MWRSRPAPQPVERSRPGLRAQQRCRLPNRGARADRSAVRRRLRLPYPCPLVHQSCMQDAARWYSAASAPVLEAGLACLQPARGTRSRVCAGLDQPPRAAPPRTRLRRRSGSAMSRDLAWVSQSQLSRSQCAPSESASEIALDLAAEGSSLRAATIKLAHARNGRPQPSRHYLSRAVGGGKRRSTSGQSGERRISAAFRAFSAVR